MVKKLVPTHKYKTSVLFFDDDVDYLKFLKDNLISDKYNFYFVSNIDDFNDLITASENIRRTLPEPFIKLDNELSDDLKHEVFDFNISNLNVLKKINNKSFEVSTVFIDDDLKISDYDGFSLCESLEGFSFNKILLTGQNDRVKALKAMNSDAVDLYIEKFNTELNLASEQNIIEKILGTLDKVTDKFFINKNTYINELITDLNFRKLFSLMVEKYNASSYYLSDRETFLITEYGGSDIHLKCWHKNKFQEYYQLHFDELDYKKAEKLEKIRNEYLIPTKIGLQKPIEYNELYYCVF